MPVADREAIFVLQVLDSVRAFVFVEDRLQDWSAFIVGEDECLIFRVNSHVEKGRIDCAIIILTDANPIGLQLVGIGLSNLRQGVKIPAVDLDRKDLLRLLESNLHVPQPMTTRVFHGLSCQLCLSFPAQISDFNKFEEHVEEYLPVADRVVT